VRDAGSGILRREAHRKLTSALVRVTIADDPGQSEAPAPSSNSTEHAWGFGCAHPSDTWGFNFPGTQPWARTRPPQRVHLPAGLQCHSGRLHGIRSGSAGSEGDRAGVTRYPEPRALSFALICCEQPACEAASGRSDCRHVVLSFRSAEDRLCPPRRLVPPRRLFSRRAYRREGSGAADDRCCAPGD
jgi:hypothetical protein